MELEKHITDERTGIGYTLCGDYYLHDLKLPEEKRGELRSPVWHPCRKAGLTKPRLRD